MLASLFIYFRTDDSLFGVRFDEERLEVQVLDHWILERIGLPCKATFLVRTVRSCHLTSNNLLIFFLTLFSTSDILKCFLYIASNLFLSSFLRRGQFLALISSNVFSDFFWIGYFTNHFYKGKLILITLHRWLVVHCLTILEGHRLQGAASIWNTAWEGIVIAILGWNSTSVLK